jgi:3-dehydroquinate synthase
LTRILTVELGARSYPIHIGAGLLSGLGEKIRKQVTGRRVLVVTNPTVKKLYGAVADRSLAAAGLDLYWAEIPDGEEHKTLAVAARLYDLAFDAGLDRDCPVVALGGGVVGDITGFVAATYLRGVPFVQVPTTLLAQVDSSVGGKVAVNHPRGKNIIGAFYQPRLVVADTDTLLTLPEREIRAGIGEIIKYGVIADAEFFAWLENNLERLSAGNPETLAYAVEISCRIKAAVVAADETEQGHRQILNYGHTIGHAIESLTDYREYLHGEAISIGMVAAARLAVRLGMLDETAQGRIEHLVQRAGLPTALPPGLDFEAVLASLQRDKKARAGRITFILPEAVGRVRICPDIASSVLRPLFPPVTVP